MKGLQFGQYHGWGGGTEVPFINLLNMMGNKSSGTSSNTTSSDNDYEPYKGLNGTSAQMTAASYDVQIKKQQGRSMAQQGFNMIESGDAAKGREMYYKGMSMINNAAQEAVNIDSQRELAIRHASKHDAIVSNHRDAENYVAVKNGMPYFLAMTDDKTLREMSAQRALYTSSETKNRSVFNAIDFNSGFNYVNDMPYRTPYYSEESYPDLFPSGTNFMNTVNTQWSLASNRFNQEANTTGDGYTKTVHSVKDNLAQITEFAGNSRSWLAPHEKVQLDSEAYHEYFNNGIQFVSEGTPSDVIASIPGIDKAGLLINSTVLRNDKGELIDRNGKIVTDENAATIYSYYLNSNYVGYKRDGELNFIDANGRIVANKDGSNIDQSDGKKTSYKDAQQLTGLDARNAMSNIPELYLTEKMYNQYGSYKQSYKNDAITMRAMTTNNINNNMGTEVEASTTNYFGNLQMATPSMGSIKLGVNGGGSSTPYAVIYSADVNMPHTTASKNIQSKWPNESGAFNLTLTDGGIWARGGDGTYYSMPAKSTGNNMWNNDLQLSVVDLSGDGYSIPKSMTNIDAAKFIIADFGTYYSESRNKGGRFDAIFGVGSMNTPDTDNSIRRWVNNPNRKNEFLYTPAGYDDMLIAINSNPTLDQDEKNKFSLLYGFNPSIDIDAEIALGSMAFAEKYSNAFATEYRKQAVNGKFVYDPNELKDFQKFIEGSIIAKIGTKNASDAAFIYPASYLKNDEGWTGFMDIRDPDYERTFVDNGTSASKWESRTQTRMVSTGVMMKASLPDDGNDAWRRLKNVPIPIKVGRLNKKNEGKGTTTLNELAKDNIKVYEDFIKAYATGAQDAINTALTTANANDYYEYINPFMDYSQYIASNTSSGAVSDDDKLQRRNVLYMQAYAPILLNEGIGLTDNNVKFAEAAMTSNRLAAGPYRDFFETLYMTKTKLR